eukprot:c18057_g1_i1 orf=585-2702(-)
MRSLTMDICILTASWLPSKRVLFWLRFFVAILIESVVDGQTVAFSFDSLSTKNLTLLGDSFIQNGNLGLTRETPVPASSTGRGLYNTPVRFLDPGTNSSASFQTSFSFSISNQNSEHYGDGVVFVIVADDHTLGGTGGWLGFLNSSNSGKSSSHAIGIEFDTFLDVNFLDINNNHVALDINSMHSIVSADAGSVQMDLKSGDVITAWIEYNSSRSELQAWISYTGQKPPKPLLVANISLAPFLKEFMYVGFSSSTEGSQELHFIYTWNFATSGIPEPSSSPVSQSHHSSSSQIVPTNSSAPVPTPQHPLTSTTKFANCRGPFCISVASFSAATIGAAIFLALIILSAMWCLYGRYRILMKRSFSSHSPSDSLVRRPRKFTYRELSVATKGFRSNRVVGHGAFGTVYRGVLYDTGEVVAVKRSVGNNQGESEFLAELSIIACLRHRNLVQLLGWCHEKREILLVYDYMPNGSLDKLLFNKNGMVLPWVHRYKIVMGVVAALAYLHGECEQQIVHRDVKPSNIMLDSSFNARLGDFGLARLTDHNKSPDVTLTAGTMGYLAPEYIHTGKASEKTDVFSFGAVVLEIACGRRALEKDLSPSENVMVDWVWELYREGRLLEAADPRLGEDYSKEEMNCLLQVGLLCSHPDPLARPTMLQLLQILKGEAHLPPLPRFKPTPSFAVSMRITLQDIISEAGHSPTSSLSDSL